MSRSCQGIGHWFKAIWLASTKANQIADFLISSSDWLYLYFKSKNRKNLKFQIICYACPRTSKHNDLSAFIDHIIQIHLPAKKSLRDKKNTLLWVFTLFALTLEMLRILTENIDSKCSLGSGLSFVSISSLWIFRILKVMKG